MKRITVVILMAAALGASAAERTFTGVVTDSMCGADHSMMKITPDAKCARECVKGGGSVKYALLSGGKVYKLSDQETPAKFAGQRVKVTGKLFEKTGIIQSLKIEAAK
jgi:sialic acid synthase SpsE